MLKFLRRTPKKITIRTPRLGILNLKGEAVEPLIAEDRAAMAPLFSSVEISEFVTPRCDVLFAYCDLTADGYASGSGSSLREIVRDSGTAVVVVASENPQEGIIAATKKTGYGHANLAVTLQRKGPAFSSFYRRLFEAMAQGTTMPVAWVRLAPQIPGYDHPDCPSGFFLCEAGQIAFK